MDASTLTARSSTLTSRSSTLTPAARLLAPYRRLGGRGIRHAGRVPNRGFLLLTAVNGCDGS